MSSYLKGVFPNLDSASWNDWICSSSSEDAGQREPQGRQGFAQGLLVLQGAREEQERRTGMGSNHRVMMMQRRLNIVTAKKHNNKDVLWEGEVLPAILYPLGPRWRSCWILCRSLSTYLTYKPEGMPSLVYSVPDTKLFSLCPKNPVTESASSQLLSICDGPRTGVPKPQSGDQHQSAACQ